ncbi:hypothetical protein WSK_2588 [Novosphingobium sp. Rr 2-17]|uniref:hypothetical protein n=1 Tax=Novosphingobium sp. Rr 2-17 TaxID=555793 RepID=UPI0002698213|nr:hypothetical protein [Novosphingobium sp. Rr 2-17]EIZ79043.1 hypothetical protein WSK_2588 [Novosphingobium sp. Rr 2-17]
MSRDSQLTLTETWPRFLAHWIAAVFGHFLKVVLPLIADWPFPLLSRDFPAWWAVLLFAATTSLLAAVINCNLPVTARELMKSVAFGLALNATGEILNFA